MAKIRAMIGSGGGGEALVETLLWTNPSITSNFAEQTITLSDSISNYDYIKIQFFGSTSSSVSSSVMTPVQDFILQNSNNNTLRSLTHGFKISSGLFLRAVDYVSDTSIMITNALKLNASTNNNSCAIPYRVYGVKKSSSGGGENLKLMEPTVVAGDNTIETGVTIKQLVIMWQNSSGSHPNYYYVGEWNYQRPNYALRGYTTTSSAILETSLPYSSATSIKSVGTTSFVLNVHQADINNIGGNPRCYIYY